MRRWVCTGVAAAAATGAGAGCACCGASADAPADSGYTISSTIGLVSDYRRGGLSRSGEEPALQGGVNLDAPSGWSAGMWASNIEERKGAKVEVELYAAKSFDVGETEVTVTATAIVFPGGDGADLAFAGASAARAVGPLDLTLSVKYAWEQRGLNDEDNLNYQLKARTPFGEVGGVPITLNASIGHTDGRQAIEGTKTDWSFGAVAGFDHVDVGVLYTDTDLEDERGNPAVVISFVHNF